MDTTLHNLAEKGVSRQLALLRTLRENADQAGLVRLTDRQLAGQVRLGTRSVQLAIAELKAKGTIACTYHGAIGIKRTIQILG